MCTSVSDLVYDSVLVLLDGSYLAVEALPAAVAKAREQDVPLILLNVLAPYTAQFVSAPYTSYDRERQVRRSQMQAYLDGLRHSLDMTGLRIETRVEEGEPVATILKVANDLGSPMIVLTSSGMSATRAGERPAAGSVHHQVVAGWPGQLLLIEV